MRSRVCLAAVLCLSAPWPTFASNSASDAGIETVTVTAHRLPSRTATLPVAVRDLEHEPATGVDALRDLPGLAISQAGSLGTLTQVRVRGAEANHLLVLIDGVEIMDPTTDAGFNFANLNLAGVARLEYLPGAQSAVWGSDAMAGVLQLTTRPAVDSRRVTLEGGSFDTKSGTLQLAAIEDNYHYNLSVADFSTDGTNIARSGSERDGYDNTSVMLSAGWQEQTWALRALLRNLVTRSDYDPTPFPAFLPEDGDRQNQHHETLATITMDLSGDKQSWQEVVTVAWFGTDNRTLEDGLRTASTDGGRWEVSSVTRLMPSPRQSLEVLLEHERETFEQRGQASAFGDPNQSQTIRTTSAGLEYVLAPTERLRISASGRFDHSSEFKDSESLRLAVSYYLLRSSRIWAAAGNGIKHPSFVERFGFTPDSFIGNPSLKAEQNRHLSLGLEHESGPWRLAGTLYRDRLEDEINGFYFDPAAGGFTAVNQNGRSKRQGVEIDMTRSWTDTRVHFGASYLHAEEPDGTREIRRPRWLGYLSASRTWRGAEFMVDVFRVETRTDLDFATFPATSVDLDAYTLVNARVRIPVTARAAVTVRGSNLLDRRYEDQWAYRSPGRALYFQLGIDL